MQLRRLKRFHGKYCPMYAIFRQYNIRKRFLSTLYRNLFFFLYSAFGKQHFGINLAKKKGSATNNKHQKWILEQDIISDFSMRSRFIKTMALVFSFIQNLKFLLYLTIKHLFAIVPGRATITKNLLRLLMMSQKLVNQMSTYQ